MAADMFRGAAAAVMGAARKQTKRRPPQELPLRIDLTKDVGRVDRAPSVYFVSVSKREAVNVAPCARYTYVPLGSAAASKWSR